MRLRKIRNASELLAAEPQLVINNPKERLGKWKDLFGNDHPLHLELGMGKGQFIIKMATLNPDINYIGIELFDSVIVQAMKKAKVAKLPNLLLVNADGNHLLSFFQAGEIEKIYLNFSDPWPKVRHAKRRLTNSGFLEIYRSILVPKGEVEFKTDNAHLFEYSIVCFNNQQYQFLDFSVNLHSRTEEIITTEYEDRFIEMNKPIYYIKAKVKA